MRRLANAAKKIKSLIEDAPDLPKDIFVVIVIILVGCASFAMGRLSAAEHLRRSELRVLSNVPQNTSLRQQTAVASATGMDAGRGVADEEPLPLPAPRGMYVASKNGTTYHLPWCSGASRIKDENKVWFATKEEAEAQGLRPAANCKGI